MKINITDVKDNDDDTCTLSVDLDQESIIALAKIGLIKILTDECERIIKENEKS
jgi:hypothetical protein